MELIQQGVNPIGFPGLKVSITSDDSRNINVDEECKVIISASGMCDAGRIKHHLKHNLWNWKSTILFVGYQAVGTLGRNLVEGATRVKIFGEDIQVNAQICVLPGISGHADQEGLMRWAGSFQKKPKMVFVTHGEDKVTESFAQKLTDELGYQTMAPYSGTIYNLVDNVCEYRAAGIPKKKEETVRKSGGSAVFQKLLGLGQRLLMVIHKNEGGANKDLEKFAREVQSLCDKWDR